MAAAHRSSDAPPPPAKSAAECGTFYAFKPPPNFAGLVSQVFAPPGSSGTLEAASPVEPAPTTVASPEAPSAPRAAIAPGLPPRPVDATQAAPSAQTATSREPAPAAVAPSDPPATQGNFAITPPISAPPLAAASRRNRRVAVMLAFLLGGLGVHKYYLGRFGVGVVYGVFAVTLVPALLGWFDAFALMRMTDDEFDAQYNHGF